MSRRALAAPAVLAVLVALAVLPAAAPARARFDTRVFAHIPRPGFPAMAYVGPDKHVYEGTYDNPAGDHVPSRVFEYAGDGRLLRSWTVRGQDLSQAHGVQVGTMGPRGGLYLLDKSPPRIVRLNRRTGAQHVYATFPAGAVPDYAAWGPDRALYVTDYEGATVWRVPWGGGTPRSWLRGPELDGGPFGTTGIVLAADRRTFVIGQQSAAGLGAGNPSTGRLYTVAIRPDGSPGPVRTLWESRPADGPDGFAIARSGHVYVACLAANQLVELGADGRELARFPSVPGAGLDGSSVPFDSPSSVRFRYRRLLIANQSYFTGRPADQTILDVYAGEPGLPEYVPGRHRHRHR